MYIIFHSRGLPSQITDISTEINIRSNVTKSPLSPHDTHWTHHKRSLSLLRLQGPLPQESDGPGDLPHGEQLGVETQGVEARHPGHPGHVQRGHGAGLPVVTSLQAGDDITMYEQDEVLSSSDCMIDGHVL